VSARGWITGAVVATGILVGYVAIAISDDVDTGSGIATTIALYVVAAVTGLLVWRQPGTERMGALIVAWAITFLTTDAWVYFPHSRLLATVLPLFMGLSGAVYAHMVLAYPSGRLRDRLDRAAVCVFYVAALLPAAVLVLTWDPQGCPDCRPAVRSYVFVDWIDRQPAYDLANGFIILLGGAFLALLVRRWFSVSATARLSLWPLGVAATFAVVQFMVAQVAEIGELWGWTPTLDRLDQIATVAVPVSLACGVVLSERRRRAVGDLVVELGAAGPGRARDALAAALDDPSLELLLWEPARRRWITPDGTGAELPNDPSRSVTMIGDRLAAIVHDPDLADQRRLVTTAGSAARLSLENERLQAELRAQLRELRASRARIVTVGDEQRRRLERDLHDGAQQRLLGVGLSLQLLRPRLGAPGEAEPVLLEAEAELRTALEELRELARGIHPAILTEQGLEPALEGLASRASIPIALETRLCGALPPEVESAVYFVAAEALTNVVKHANATSASVSLARQNGMVRLVVSDDGQGGADAAGSGLVGLADRVGALGGRLAVESSRATGTRLDVEIPCASS